MAGAIELDLLDVGDGLLSLGVVEGDRHGAIAPTARDRVGLDEVDAAAIIRDGTVTGIDLDSDFFGGAVVILVRPFVVVGEGGNADFLEAGTAKDVLCTASLDSKTDAAPWDCDKQLILAVALEGEGAIEVEGCGADQVTAVFLQNAIVLGHGEFVTLLNLLALVEEAVISGDDDMGGVEGVAEAFGEFEDFFNCFFAAF